MPSDESLNDSATNGNKSIHSLDLPQLYKRPSFLELLQVLELLKLPPPSWNSKSRKPQEPNDAQGISCYLTKIIGSGLDWLSIGVSEEEWEQRCELIHELASKRLAERCGRSAMPEMVRTWVIPTSEHPTDLTIELCEPPLTGDSLGLKTWGTSFVMAKKLEELGNLYFGNILSNGRLIEQGFVTSQNVLAVESGMTVRIELTMGSDEMMSNNAAISSSPTKKGNKALVRRLMDKIDPMQNEQLSCNCSCNKGKILELGSGTGLLGLTAAMLWNRTTILTDLPDIVPNLDVNLRRNGFGQTPETNATAAILDWSDAEHSVVFSQNPNDKFEMILVADPFYDSHHPALLAGTIPKFLKNSRDSRVLVSVPLRDNATRAMKSDFEGLMSTRGYQVVASGTERCFDDWEESEQDDIDGVYCWWGIWKHAVATSAPICP
ncbi:a0a3f2a0-8641-4b26-b5aa-05ada50d916a [Sclerotinia trifoliorum]|uniref:A0a3f2a0-8641-4b26-b5aa-05ada50d916a n=1 Tax=Sclerotinia trifoliorum TaxID=28548 RepID=A0A8H2ZLS0_9HELO|nr:a0a3f2a0-8641-4b26-b5aa-05ada50d916a [Sclerotinia trifoliorum]